MSVEKMKKYKESKVGRKARLEKERRKKKLTGMLLRLAGVLCVVALVVAIGVTVKNEYDSYLAGLPDYTGTTSMMVEDLAGVLEEETEAAEEAAVEAEEEAVAEAEEEAVAENAEGTATEIEEEAAVEAATETVEEATEAATEDASETE